MQRKNWTHLVTLGDFVRTERQARGLSRVSLARRSDGHAGRGDILVIEDGSWPTPPTQVLDGIARGLECDDEKKAADLWVKMMVLCGYLSSVQIAAIKRLPTRIRFCSPAAATAEEADRTEVER